MFRFAHAPRAASHPEGAAKYDRPIGRRCRLGHPSSHGLGPARRHPMIDVPASAASRRIRRVALGDFVHRSARKFGARTAVVDGDIRLSYAELDARSSRFAHHLLATIGSGRQVGMLCANSADMVVAYNGIHKSGNVWVPVNIRLDPGAIEYILKHAEVSAVVVDEALRAEPALAALLDRLGVPLVLTQRSEEHTSVPRALTPE